MESCRSADVTKVVELGPGNALARMMHDFMQDSDVHSLSEFHSLSGFESPTTTGHYTGSRCGDPFHFFMCPTGSGDTQRLSV